MSRRKAEHQPLSPEALELVARRFRALGDPTRLGILQQLFDGERTVSELCARTGGSQANVSKHLNRLASEGILARRKEGLFVYYRIEDGSIRDLCEVVCGALLERFERAGRHFG